MRAHARTDIHIQIRSRAGSYFRNALTLDLDLDIDIDMQATKWEDRFAQQTPNAPRCRGIQRAMLGALHTRNFDAVCALFEGIGCCQDPALTELGASVLTARDAAVKSGYKFPDIHAVLLYRLEIFTALRARINFVDRAYIYYDILHKWPAAVGSSVLGTGWFF